MQLKLQILDFLDSEQQAGTGSDNKSVVEKEISLQKQEKEMYTAKINDRIGLSSFADTAVVKYNASDELTSYDAEASAVQMGAFYEKNGEIFGNIGFDKSISYANEGSICAWRRKSSFPAWLWDCPVLLCSPARARSLTYAPTATGAAPEKEADRVQSAAQAVALCLCSGYNNGEALRAMVFWPAPALPERSCPRRRWGGVGGRHLCVPPGKAAKWVRGRFPTDKRGRPSNGSAPKIRLWG